MRWDYGRLKVLLQKSGTGEMAERLCGVEPFGWSSAYQWCRPNEIGVRIVRGTRNTRHRMFVVVRAPLPGR